MIVSKCHSARIEKALKDFYDHAKKQGPIVDTTAQPDQGDDLYYYELDATVVEALLDLIEESR